MKLIQSIVILGVPVAFAMVLGIPVSELAASPQPLITYGLFAGLHLFYTPHVLKAPWFKRGTYTNLLRIYMPAFTWGGVGWGLAGLAMTAGESPFPSSTSYMGVSLLMGLGVLGVPLLFKKNDSARGGPQQLSRSGNQLEDAVALAVEKANARAQLALEHEDLEQVADAVGVPAEVLQEAVSEVQGNAIMPSQPSPQTSLKKPPSS